MNDFQLSKLWELTIYSVFLKIFSVVGVISALGVFFASQSELQYFFLLFLVTSVISLAYCVFVWKRLKKDLYYQEKMRQVFILSRRKKTSFLENEIKKIKREIRKLEEEKEEFEEIKISIP